ncbi:hypothetical protein ES288_D04G174400v1 [Gossypium darwinii]|uniref:Uncharacterized protein n=1 Tax=Gossypium darwinii TaxID=34276 RepID=A0A5D2CYG4_GOSDA|nr:hypothetical protein ES288_D04G174400v1 [Gossypium darwinii]
MKIGKRKENWQAKPKEDRTFTQVIFVVGGEAQNRNMANELNVEDGEYSEPVSPTAQYLNSSVLSVCILAVLDSEIPVDDSPALGLLKDVFLPISPRFSSLMVEDENGVKHWKKVEVKLEDHIAMEKLPHNRPLWNIHIIKYPTSNAAGNLIFKLHHSLGDGYSLMADLLSCLQRADSPSVPLTFPTLTSAPNPNLSVGGTSIFRNIPKVLRSAFNTVSDFGWSLMKSSYVEDDISLIRSGNPGVEFKLVLISTMTFSLDDIKQIKTKLRVTINVVITGIIFLGTRLYMQEGRNKSTNEHSTALVLLNTKAIREYKSVKEIHKPYAEKVWGNQFAFLHNSIPELTSLESLNPLDFRNSGAVFLTVRLLEWFRKFKGPNTILKNSSMALSNIIGPVEQMALANHPIKSLYFMMVGGPEILTVTMFSYMGKLRVAFKTEKGFIDPEKLKSSIHNAFEMMLKVAQDIA